MSKAGMRLLRAAKEMRDTLPLIRATAEQLYKSEGNTGSLWANDETTVGYWMRRAALREGTEWEAQ